MRVSAVICAYNSEGTIERAVQSLLGQQHRPEEILVIDDASSDGTVGVVGRLAQHDPRIRCVVCERNGGIAAARNLALNIAACDWMFFLDADDKALPGMLEAQVARARQDGRVVAVGTYAYYADGTGRILGVQRARPLTERAFLESWQRNSLVMIPPPALFSRRHALAAGGYRTGGLPVIRGVRLQDLAEDVDLWTRMADSGADGFYMVVVPRPLFVYTKAAGTLSAESSIHMANKLRWIKHVTQQRRSGSREASFVEFLEERPFSTRVSHYLFDRAVIRHKEATFAFMRRRYARAASNALLAFLLSPRYVLSKFRMQSLRR